MFGGGRWSTAVGDLMGVVPNCGKDFLSYLCVLTFWNLTAEFEVNCTGLKKSSAFGWSLRYSF